MSNVPDGTRMQIIGKGTTENHGKWVYRLSWQKGSTVISNGVN